MKCLVLVDSIDYVNSEVYQQHLHPVLRKKLNCQYVELCSIATSVLNDRFDIIYSALKLRTLLAHLHTVKQFIGDRPIYVQDYDPWVSFVDDSQYKGAYYKIKECLNVKAFVISSNEWAKFLTLKGFNCKTIKLGIPTHACNCVEWQNRTKNVEFRGSYRDYREKNFNLLEQFGIKDVWKKDFVPYKQFNSYLDTLKVWLQFEATPAIVDGVQVTYNALWPKTIEILSRGCVVIRDYQPEALYYEVDKLPTALLCRNIEDVPLALKDVLSKTDNEMNIAMRETVSFIKRQRYYEKFVEDLIDWSKE